MPAVLMVYNYNEQNYHQNLSRKVFCRKDHTHRSWTFHFPSLQTEADPKYHIYRIRYFRIYPYKSGDCQLHHKYKALLYCQDTILLKPYEALWHRCKQLSGLFHLLQLPHHQLHYMYRFLSFQGCPVPESAVPLHHNF